jgi:hypothetical protein
MLNADSALIVARSLLLNHKHSCRRHGTNAQALELLQRRWCNPNLSLLELLQKRWR